MTHQKSGQSDLIYWSKFQKKTPKSRRE